MAVLSNNGRLISSLPLASQVLGTDELLVQSNGITKRLPYSAFTSSILAANKFNPYGSPVHFSSLNNKFTGSFYSTTNKLANFAVVNVRQGITVAGLSTLDTVLGNTFTGNFIGNLNGNVGGNLIGNVNGQLTGSMIGVITGSIYSNGKSTFNNIDVNGGTIDGTIIGATSTAAITGTTITANTGFVGNLTGNLTGDVYNSTTTKVLESGNTTPTVNGGVASAFFYGTSSYASQALTAAYALAGGGAAVNGLPVGGNPYQILAKKTGTNYDVVWTNPITSSYPGNPNNLVVWDGLRSIRDYNNFYYNGSDSYICTAKLVSNGISLSAGAFTGSYKGNFQNIVASSGDAYKIVDGDQYSSVLLRLSASAYVTVSLMNGQTSTVLVQNSNNFNILKWSGSLNGGATANTKIYWKNGIAPTITSGDKKKDVITFVNINNLIFGSTVQNFS